MSSIQKPTAKNVPKMPFPKEPKTPAVKRKQEEEEKTPVAKKQALDTHSAANIKKLREEAAAAIAKADKIEAEMKAAERKARLTPPFELFHGAVISGESTIVGDGCYGLVKPEDDDEWEKVQCVTVDGSEKWKWAPLTGDGPLYLCRDCGDSCSFEVYRNVEINSNDPKPIPSQEEPLECV